MIEQGKCLPDFGTSVRNFFASIPISHDNTITISWSLLVCHVLLSISHTCSTSPVLNEMMQQVIFRIAFLYPQHSWGYLVLSMSFLSPSSYLVRSHCDFVWSFYTKIWRWYKSFFRIIPYVLDKHRTISGFPMPSLSCAASFGFHFYHTEVLFAEHSWREVHQWQLID